MNHTLKNGYSGAREPAQQVEYWLLSQTLVPSPHMVGWESAFTCNSNSRGQTHIHAYK